MGNASLDDFVADPEPDANESEPDANESEADANEPDANESEPEPTPSAYGWTPDGVDCADCGATVERRWRDDGRFVCPDCKDW